MTKLEIKIISLFITFSWYQRFDKSRAGSFANLSIIRRFGIPEKKTVYIFNYRGRKFQIVIWPKPDTECQVWAKCAKLSYLTVDIFEYMSRSKKPSANFYLE